MATTSVIPRQKLSQAVQQRLLDRIRSGEFPPGSQLPSERELMELYGVGRPAIREALQTLERSGILTITHGERAKIAIPTADKLIQQVAEGTRHLLALVPANLEHLKDARVFLETGMARRAAENATQDSLAMLTACFKDHIGSLNNLAEFTQRDMAFHRQIAAMTGNPIFPALIEAMFGWLSSFYVQLVRVEGAENITLTEHRRILDAIAARDPVEAESAMRDHLTRANALYRQFETPTTKPFASERP